MPAVVTLPPDLLPLLEAHGSELSALGFDAEAFGGGSVRLRALPASLRNADPEAALRDLLRDYRDRETAEWIVSGTRERLAATVACHSSVRAGQSLPRETLQAIVADLGRTEHPTLCPHGRPTMVRIPREDLSRWFGRSGWRRQ
jgi:DNA mismatch repair protein MutL